MPQAPDYLREEWHHLGDSGTAEWLEAQGYKEAHFYWVLPNPDHVPTEKEERAILYLIYEWDWGGIISDEEAADINDRMQFL